MRLNNSRGAQERIIGQTEAVRALARAMWRARTGLKDPRRPIAAVLFAGGTGVGKTETTKACPPGWAFGSGGFAFAGGASTGKNCQDSLHNLGAIFFQCQFAWQTLAVQCFGSTLLRADTSQVTERHPVAKPVASTGERRAVC